MNDMGRQKFEDAFRDAFQDAELTPTEKVWSKVERDLDKTSGDFKAAFLDAELAPTDTVWTNVELDLERAAGQKMRRRLLFYKMLAAASVAFAMCMAGVGYYAYNMRDEGMLSKNEAVHSSEVAPATEDESSTNLAVNENSEAAKATDHATADPSRESQPSSSRGNVPEASETNGLAPGNDHVTSSESASSSSSPSSTGTPDDKRPNSSGTQQSSLAVNVPSGKDTPANKDNSRTKRVTTSSIAASTTATTSIVTNADVKSVKSSSGNPSEGSSTGNQAANTAGVYAIQNNSAEGENTKDAQVVAATMPGNPSNESQSVNGKDGQDRLLLDGQQAPLLSTIVVADAKLPEEPKSNADPFMLMMLQREDEARAMNAKAKKNKKNISNEQLWTSVGMTAGTYNTVNRSISNDMAASAVRSATSQAKASGLAYSFGVSVGTKLSERWVVQGGLNYLNQMSDYTSNILVPNGGGGFNALTASNAAVLSDTKLEARDDVGMKFAQTPLFGISSSMEFISIPVEAGYLVVNKKVGVMLNAGVSTDLFLQNTESANVSGAAKSVQTQERGESDSPYRDVNFIGLIGTEVSYKVGQRYRVALTPGLRYPFNSMYKSESQIQATPVTFDVGLKFRYIFQ